jgi:hypothetical protein
MEFIEDRDTLDRYCEAKLEPRALVDGVPIGPGLNPKAAAREA